MSYEQLAYLISLHIIYFEYDTCCLNLYKLYVSFQVYKNIMHTFITNCKYIFLFWLGIFYNEVISFICVFNHLIIDFIWGKCVHHEYGMYV